MQICGKVIKVISKSSMHLR